jgi:hypothetical protein
MAHFAEIDQDGYVLQVIVIANEEAPDPAPDHSEPLGQRFIASLGLPGQWIQTSYHGSFRKQYAGPGFRYYAEADVFVTPCPGEGWTLDDNYDWQPPPS